MDYSSKYSDQKLELKFAFVPKEYACRIVFAANVLFYVMKADTTPRWVVVKIVAALGYLIAPFDFIPDWIFPLGYVDDLNVLILLFDSSKGIIQYVSPAIIEKAKTKTMNILAYVRESDLDLLVTKWHLNEMDN